MNNLISLFMNYKISRLVEYGIFLYGEDSEFLRRIFKEYFSVYVDNYYYGIFYTVEDAVYSLDNLKEEFAGMEKELLDDYLQYELVEDNDEYQEHISGIRKLKDFSLEVLKIDSLDIEAREDITPSVEDFVSKNAFFKEHIGDQLSKFTKLVRESFQTIQKLLKLEDHFFEIKQKSFIECNEVYYLELDPHINILHNYRKSMVSRVYQEEGLERAKFECIVQKISLRILKSILEKKELPLFIIELRDDFIKRGKIIDEVYEFINNPLFRHYVSLGVSYNSYASQKEAFMEDFHFACIQDYSHINDIFQKTDNISKEGVFDYLIVSDYRYKDKDFFLNFESGAIKVLVFEEE